MGAKTTHFKVDNGDMTLIEFESGKKLLIDIKIRLGADDSEDDTPDVGTQLRDRLDRDDKERKFVDAFLLTHPDKDHVTGLQKHFHLGQISDWSKDDDKIVIREMWSSPIIFRRAERKNGTATLCDDAKAWGKEARRRVAKFREAGSLGEGDRIKILGEDVNGKTDDLTAILIKTGSRFSSINGATDTTFEALLLAPMLAKDDEEDDVLSKNNSSVILRLDIAADKNTSAAKYLIGGDAEVGIWERVWAGNDKKDLEYDVLIAPHHCSWHSLSWDSWSKMGEKAKVSPDARSALSQVNPGATIIASSCEIKDDDNDPPCVRAQREYKSILKPVAGDFRCLGSDAGTEPFELTISEYGPKPPRAKVAAGAALGTGIGTEALAHGSYD